MNYLNRQDRRREWKRKEKRIRQHDMLWEEFNDEFIKRRPFLKGQIFGKNYGER